MSVTQEVKITTTEMHTGGEPLRIVETGYPHIPGHTLLEKRRYAQDNLDQYRRFLMDEPRGHHDMYGALPVKPDHPDADLAVLFIHNAGYSTMCGHAIISLGRYVVDRGLHKAKRTTPETEVNIQCPCGLVKVFVECDDRKSGSVRFHSVPAFAFALDVTVDVPPYGKVTVDIGYGGAFYALATAESVGLNVKTSRMADIVDAATAISEAVRAAVTLTHPDDADLAFLYGTIITDGADTFSDVTSTANVCVFSNREVDRCPTGSGVTARIAVQFKRKLISLNQTRTFESGATGSRFTGKAIRETKCGDFDAVVVEVSGRGHYTGSNTFTCEDDDDLRNGFFM